MPGFDFSNYNRNAALHARGVPLPKATSTGTTIVGCIYDGGVVIAADTRATSGPIVADKNCEKLHYISPQIWCAGAGTAADTEFTTALISSQLELHSLSTGRKPRVVTCMTLLKQHLFKYQGYIGAYLVVAGVDPTGTHLFTVHAHGSTDKLPYVTMGSGSLAAMSVFETQWKPTMTKEDAMELCSQAIQAGIFNDLGSGSNVDLAVITAEKTTLHRGHVKPNERSQKLKNYKFARGTTAVLNEKIITKDEIGKYVSVEEVETEEMEVDAPRAFAFDLVDRTLWPKLETYRYCTAVVYLHLPAGPSCRILALAKLYGSTWVKRHGVYLFEMLVDSDWDGRWAGRQLNSLRNRWPYEYHMALPIDAAERRDPTIYENPYWTRFCSNHPHPWAQNALVSCWSASWSSASSSSGGNIV
ncbi:hypothetical protein DL764_010759 [Monosporascus ibericus]|uniref:proteasome endopeptidase complex n=1 Tax=Monosporascus ibericus TaxID=155417 RepID=A0A4Q4SS65_9PEZI|nr:hypothetical protein DL764_010759 [Monosporascus ibericus]